MKTESVIIWVLCGLVLLLFVFTGGLLLGKLAGDYEQEQRNLNQERIDEVGQPLDTTQELGTTSSSMASTTTITSSIWTSTTWTQTTTTKYGTTTTTTTLTFFPVTLRVEKKTVEYKVYYGGHYFVYQGRRKDQKTTVNIGVDGNYDIQIPTQWDNNTIQNGLKITVFKIEDDYILLHIKEV